MAAIMLQALCNTACFKKMDSLVAYAEGAALAATSNEAVKAATFLNRFENLLQTLGSRLDFQTVGTLILAAKKLLTVPGHGVDTEHFQAGLQAIDLVTESLRDVGAWECEGVSVAACELACCLSLAVAEPATQDKWRVLTLRQFQDVLPLVDSAYTRRGAQPLLEHEIKAFDAMCSMVRSGCSLGLVAHRALPTIVSTLLETLAAVSPPHFHQLQPAVVALANRIASQRPVEASLSDYCDLLGTLLAWLLDVPDHLDAAQTLASTAAAQALAARLAAAHIGACRWEEALDVLGGLLDSLPTPPSVACSPEVNDLFQKAMACLHHMSAPWQQLEELAQRWLSHHGRVASVANSLVSQQAESDPSCFSKVFRVITSNADSSTSPALWAPAFECSLQGAAGSWPCTPEQVERLIAALAASQDMNQLSLTSENRHAVHAAGDVIKVHAMQLMSERYASRASF